MSDHPKRFLDDADASESMREALRLSAELPASDYDLSKGLARLQAAIMLPIAAGPSVPDVSAPAQLAQVAGHSAKWWGLTAAGTAGVILALSVFGPGFDSSEEPDQADGYVETAPEVATTLEAPRAAVPATPEPELPLGDPDPFTGEPEPEDESQLAPTGVPNAQPPARHRAPAPTSGDDVLRREIAQLAEARRLLSDNPAGALTLVRSSQREFGAGMFREERAALEVFALMSLGRVPEARRRGRRFVRRYGHGPFTERVRQVLDQEYLAPD
ncbi:MAG: hypothetical protein ACI9KE_004200 [Polyangiales bacterium]|jgi:hypothetical protein